MIPLPTLRGDHLRPYLPALLLFLTVLSELLLVSPRIRLLESLLCRQHYPAGTPLPIPESDCKILPVQAALAHIRGWQVFFDALPVLALAIPWGIVADKIGRKKVLVMNLVGCAVHIVWFLAVCWPYGGIVGDARWVWGTSVGFVLGGGPRMGGVLVLALVADEAQDRERSTRFYYTYSAFLITELVAPPVAAALMGWSVLAPFVVALLALAAGVPVLAAIKNKSTKPATDDDEAAEALLSPHPDTTLPQPKRRGILSHLPPRPVLLVLFGHFLCPLRQELVFQITIPYASTLFSVPIARAGLLLSIIALSNLLTNLMLLPFLSRLLSSHTTLPQSRIDAATASISAAVLALGCGLLALAPGFVAFAAAAMVFGLGFGVRLALLAVLTQLVGKGGNGLGRWYAVVMVVEGVGEMVAAGGLQAVWVWGLSKRGGWEGCVWWVGAAGYALCAWVLGGLVGRGGSELVGEEEEEEEEDR